MKFRSLLLPLQWLWRIFFFVNFTVTFFLFYPFFFVMLSNRRWFYGVFMLKKVWARFLLWPPFIFWTTDYETKLDKKRAYVICSNHASYLDVILTYAVIPCYFHSMGKAELLKIPLFNHFFKRMNIPVNRKSKIDSHRAFLRAGQDIDKGISLNLFPEGTISRHAPVMGRFKNGPFKLAIEKQIPIIPITYLTNWKLLPEHSNGIGHPGISRIIVHEPVVTKGMTDENMEELKEKIYAIIEAPLLKAFPEKFQSTVKHHSSAVKLHAASSV